MAVVKPSGEETPTIEYLLSLGLGLARRIIEAEHENRLKLICPNLSYDRLFCDMFDQEDWRAGDNSNSRIDVLGHDKISALYSEFFPDPDRGPYKIWFWAHSSNAALKPYDMGSKRNWRLRGYVFWDAWRITESKILSHPFQDTWDQSRDEVEGLILNKDELAFSIAERKRIWELGGRGYWSKDDESKIVWLCSKDWWEQITENPICVLDAIDWFAIPWNDERSELLSMRDNSKLLLRRSWGPYGEYENDEF